MAKIGPGGVEISDKNAMIILGIIIVGIIILYLNFGDVIKKFFKNLATDFGLGTLFGLEERGHSSVSFQDNKLNDNDKIVLRSIAEKFNFPAYIIFRIGQIESGLTKNAHDGSKGEIGTFQIMDTLRQDFQVAVDSDQVPGIDPGTQITPARLRDFTINVHVSGWKLGKDYRYYSGNVEKTVRAYNGGRGNRNNPMTDIYWQTFNSPDLQELYPEEY
jgi:hypothetical protein